MNAKHRYSSQDFNPLRLTRTHTNEHNLPTDAPNRNNDIRSEPTSWPQPPQSTFQNEVANLSKSHTYRHTLTHTHTLHTLTEIQCLYTLILWPNISGYAQTNEHHWHKPKPEIKQKVFCVKDVARTTMTTTTTTTATKVSV